MKNKENLQNIIVGILFLLVSVTNILTAESFIRFFLIPFFFPLESIL